jgi:hypothetical protein
MKKLLIMLAFTLISCSSIEDRIKNNNYTNDWYESDNVRYQVYRMDNNNRYIIILNKRKSRFIRKNIRHETENNTNIRYSH